MQLYKISILISKNQNSDFSLFFKLANIETTNRNDLK